MINSRQINFLDGVAYIFPDDFSGIDGIGGYENSSFSYASTAVPDVEFDYGEGFGEIFAQPKKQDNYLSPDVRRIRVTFTGDTATGRFTLQNPIGGL